MEDTNAAWAPVKLQLSQSVPFASLAWLGVLCATQQAHTRMPFLRDKGGSVFQLRLFFLGYSLAMRIASEMCTRHSMTTSTLQLSSHQVTGHKFQTKAIVTSGVAWRGSPRQGYNCPHRPEDAAMPLLRPVAVHYRSGPPEPRTVQRCGRANGRSQRARRTQGTSCKCNQRRFDLDRRAEGRGGCEEGELEQCCSEFHPRQQGAGR